jgi:hypothetical protein
MNDGTRSAGTLAALWTTYAALFLLNAVLFSAAAGSPGSTVLGLLAQGVGAAAVVAAGAAVVAAALTLVRGPSLRSGAFAVLVGAAASMQFVWLLPLRSLGADALVTLYVFRQTVYAAVTLLAVAVLVAEYVRTRPGGRRSDATPR